MDADAATLFLDRVEPALRRFLDRAAADVSRIDVLRETLLALRGEAMGRTQAAARRTRPIRAALGARRRQRRIVGIIDLALRERLSDPTLDAADRAALQAWLAHEIDRLPQRVGRRLRAHYGIDAAAGARRNGTIRGSRRALADAVIALARALIARLIDAEERERLGN